MKRAITVLFVVIAALSFTAAPLFATPESTSVQLQEKKKTQTVTFKTNIHCKNCVKKVYDNLSFERGVKDLKVSLDEKLVTITYDPSKTDEDTLAKALEKLGYTAEKVETAPEA